MNYFRKIVFLLIFTSFSANFLFAQTIAQPRREKLLNGLKVLIFNEPKAEKVSLKLRIHSGSAFDPKDKMGTMALLSESLFPDEQTKTFFREDLEGSLEITSNYDYIQINATGKSDEFLTILETVATAVSNPQVTPENFAKVRDEQLKKVEELQKDPAYVADMAVARRLLGDFPYGRPANGTPESLKLIERADLLFARERFFTADNATLAISGNVKPDFAYMAARRLFGAWKKSDKLVPATFRQPDEPDVKVLENNSSDENRNEARMAVRGLARNDKDFWAAKVLVNIMKKREKGVFEHEARLLPGILMMGVSAGEFRTAPADFKNVAAGIYLNTPRADEFEAAKNEVLNELNRQNAVDFWLDADTYKLASVKTDLQNAQNVTIQDVQRVAEQFKKAPMVTVLFLGKNSVKSLPTVN